MKNLTLLGRLVPVVALVGGTLGMSAAPADAGVARPCAHPRYVTSTSSGQGMGVYYIHNNMWNTGGYRVSETLRACSPGNWSVDARADNRRRDGAVKTYPNVHRDYHNWGNGHEPRMSSFKTIRSRFASRSPRVGIYDGTFDIWMNGVADDNSTEIMIWTDNHRQVPAGRVVKRGIRFSHRTWKLWATSDHHYLAFVPNRPLRRGAVAIKSRLNYLSRHGYLRKSSTLGQICFGYEIISTGGRFHRFKIDRLSITSRRR